MKSLKLPLRKRSNTSQVDQRCYGYFPESSQRAGSEASDVHYVRGLYGKGKGRILRRRLCITLDQALYGPGLATYADSMAAIKKLVFDDKKYTLEQLNEAFKSRL